MEYAELLKAYNDLVLVNHQVSSGYEQCRLNILSQEAHIAEVIEQHSHPIYVDFLIAIVSILVYAQVTKHWLLLQELAFEICCWLSMKFMPEQAFETRCRSCWTHQAVTENLCELCYKAMHGVEPVKEAKEIEEKKAVIDQCTPMRKEFKQCASCGLQKPPKAMALDGSIDICNQCYSQTTGDPMGTIRDNANF